MEETAILKLMLKIDSTGIKKTTSDLKKNLESGLSANDSFAKKVFDTKGISGVNEEMARIAKNYQRMKELGLDNVDVTNSFAQRFSALKQTTTSAKVSIGTVTDEMKRLGKAQKGFNFDFFTFLFGGMVLEQTFGGALRSITDNYKKLVGLNSQFNRSTMKLSASFSYLQFVIGNALNNPLIIAGIESLITVLEDLSLWVEDNTELVNLFLAALASLAAIGTISVAIGGAQQIAMLAGLSFTGITAFFALITPTLLAGLFLLGLLLAGIVSSLTNPVSRNILAGLLDDLGKEVNKTIDSLEKLLKSLGINLDLTLDFSRAFIGLGIVATMVLGTIINFLRFLFIGIRLVITTIRLFAVDLQGIIIVAQKAAVAVLQFITAAIESVNGLIQTGLDGISALSGGLGKETADNFRANSLTNLTNLKNNIESINQDILVKQEEWNTNAKDLVADAGTLFNDSIGLTEDQAKLFDIKRMFDEMKNSLSAKEGLNPALQTTNSLVQDSLNPNMNILNSSLGSNVNLTAQCTEKSNLLVQQYTAQASAANAAAAAQERLNASQRASLSSQPTTTSKSPFILTFPKTSTATVTKTY